MVTLFIESGPMHKWCEALVDGLRSNATNLSLVKTTHNDLDVLERFYKISLPALLFPCYVPSTLDAVNCIVESAIFMWRKQLERQARYAYCLQLASWGGAGSHSATGG